MTLGRKLVVVTFFFLPSLSRAGDFPIFNKNSIEQDLQQFKADLKLIRTPSEDVVKGREMATWMVNYLDNLTERSYLEPGSQNRIEISGDKEKEGVEQYYNFRNISTKLEVEYKSAIELYLALSRTFENEGKIFEKIEDAVSEENIDELKRLAVSHPMYMHEDMAFLFPYRMSGNFLRVRKLLSLASNRLQHGDWTKCVAFLLENGHNVYNCSVFYPLQLDHRESVKKLYYGEEIGRKLARDAAKANELLSILDDVNRGKCLYFMALAFPVSVRIEQQVDETEGEYEKRRLQLDTENRRKIHSMISDAIKDRKLSPHQIHALIRSSAINYSNDMYEIFIEAAGEQPIADSIDYFKRAYVHLLEDVSNNGKEYHVAFSRIRLIKKRLEELNVPINPQPYPIGNLTRHIHRYGTPSFGQSEYKLLEMMSAMISKNDISSLEEYIDWTSLNIQDILDIESDSINKALLSEFIRQLQDENFQKLTIEKDFIRRLKYLGITGSRILATAVLLDPIPSKAILFLSGYYEKKFPPLANRRLLDTLGMVRKNFAEEVSDWEARFELLLRLGDRKLEPDCEQSIHIFRSLHNIYSMHYKKSGREFADAHLKKILRRWILSGIALEVLNDRFQPEHVIFRRDWPVWTRSFSIFVYTTCEGLNGSNDNLNQINIKEGITPVFSLNHIDWRSRWNVQDSIIWEQFLEAVEECGIKHHIKGLGKGN